MRAVIYGAGALGSVIGGFLAKAGHDITLVGRAEHMQAIRRHGLRITGIWGEHLIPDLRCRTTLEEATSPNSPDVVFLCAKSYDTAHALKDIACYFPRDTFLCSCQNGLGNVEQIAEYVGWEHALAARVIFGARIIAAGHAAVTVIAQPTALGFLRPSPHVPVAQHLAAIMDKAGLPTQYTENVHRLLWAKVIYNCALNPLSALLDVPYGTLAELAETRRIMNDVIDEIYRVARVMGVTLEPSTASEYQDFFYSALVPPTAAHYASMREDLRFRGKTEVDALNGYIARLGQQNQIPCPSNALLTHLIHAAEKVYDARKENIQNTY